MKPNKLIVIAIVILALAGFAAISIFAFVKSLTTEGEVVFNQNLLYVANALTGLVGGIVAFGFGLSPKPDGDPDLTILDRSSQGLGQLVYTGEVAKKQDAHGAKFKQKLGFAYALVYVLIGMAAIAVWVIDDLAPDLVANLATVFLGMVLPIVSSYLKENEL